jgi:hypothetical protein
MCRSLPSLFCCVRCSCSRSQWPHKTSLQSTRLVAFAFCPNSPERPSRFSPGGEYNPDTLTIRIDKLKSIPWPHKSPVLIDNLDLNERHVVVLTSDGKRIQSFHFKFSEDDDTQACIYFDGYEGVQFGNKKNADWCRVKVRACWH